MAGLLEANQLKRSTIEYNTTDTKALFSFTKEVFTKKFMGENKLGAQPNQIPLFILGMPRSGTTMVEKILSSHPQVFPRGKLSTLNNVFMRHVNRLSSVACGAGQRI